MEKQLLSSLITSLMISSAAFAADEYVIDDTHTFPSYEINHLGYSTQRGRFNKTSGKLTLDLAAKKGSIDVTIDVVSLNTGLKKLEDHLLGEDFFDAKQFPTITFKGDQFTFEDKKLVSVTGDFTLHGVTKPMVLKIENFKCAPHPMFKIETCGADASTTIKRTEFGISKYAPHLGDDVKIHISVEAAKNK
jgi:polyisoprenoid-binding protein YceI